MAADLMSHVASSLRWGMACVMLVTTVSAYALTDPTQPPAELDLPASGNGSAEVLEVNGLQAVILSPGRRAAIIDGQTVEQGANHGDAKLIEVSESGVVLQGTQGRRQLSLFPGVVMKRNEIALPMKIEIKPAASKAKLDKPMIPSGKWEGK